MFGSIAVYMAFTFAITEWRMDFRPLGSTAVLAVAGMPACRGERTDKPPRQFFPDMDDQPKYKAQSESPVFADGRSMREPVPGVVAPAPRVEWRVDPDRDRARDSIRPPEPP